MKELKVSNPSVQRCLDGLSVGDAFGQCFFGSSEIASVYRMQTRQLPTPPWRHTDDTEMAICIVEVLEAAGRIDQDLLAPTFARRFMNDPERGYGGVARKILTGIYAGERWQDVSPAAFGGGGSMGNGSAMRVAPIGVWFSGDPDRIVSEAARSAEVTHFSDEGRAGAIAIALAAGYAAGMDHEITPPSQRELLEYVLAYTPDCRTSQMIRAAMDLPRSSRVEEAVNLLGNGTRVTCPDTVPLCLWLAARHLDDFQGAMWTTAVCSGDIDTNCAIVGSIVAMSDGRGVPPQWINARGPLYCTDWPDPEE